MPLFLRKERGEVKLANLKINDAEVELSNFRANLEYKAKAALNEWANATEQIVLYLDNVENNRILLEGELRLFTIGESSLFLVNVRQMSFVNTRIKLVESLAKNQIARLNAYFTLGIPQ
jgi:outer membrane protein TolC